MSWFSPASGVNPLIQNFHRLNVMATFQAPSDERGVYRKFIEPPEQPGEDLHVQRFLQDGHLRAEGKRSAL
jgi:hypothetical protein